MADKTLNTGRIEIVPIPPESLRHLAHTIGALPDGDVPLAWWSSTHPQVIKGWENYLSQLRQWNSGYGDLLDACGLRPPVQYMVSAQKHLIGLVPPKGVSTVPRWLRATREGMWVPRKRTTAEKQGTVNTLFDKLATIPEAVDYLPGLPDTLWSQSGLPYPVTVRRNTATNPDAAVCAFVGADPDTASPPFEVGPQWTRMKLSTYHLLKEHHQERRRGR